MAYALDFADELSITDYKGQEEGKLMVNITPSTAQGMALDEENFVEDPKELVGKPFHFKVRDYTPTHTYTYPISTHLQIHNQCATRNDTRQTRRT